MKDLQAQIEKSRQVSIHVLIHADKQEAEAALKAWTEAAITKKHIAADVDNNWQSKLTAFFDALKLRESLVASGEAEVAEGEGGDEEEEEGGMHGI